MISAVTRAEMEDGTKVLTTADRGLLFWLIDELAWWTWDGEQLVKV